MTSPARRREITPRDPRLILRGYLNRTEPLVMRQLAVVWGKQREEIKLPGIMRAIATQAVPEEWARQWRQDYGDFVGGKLSDEWDAAAASAVASTAKDMAHVSALGYKPASTLYQKIQAWIAAHGAELITDLTEGQLKAIRILLNHHILHDPLSAQDLGRVLRSSVGLTEKRVGAVIKFRGRLIKEDLPSSVVDKQVERYAGFLHRRRAEMIARTEISSAYNFGHIEVVRDARESGLFADKRVVKVWMTADDERVCEICGPMDGVEIGIDSDFALSRPRADGGRVSIGTTQTPPAHPDCRCAEGFSVLD